MYGIRKLKVCKTFALLCIVSLSCFSQGLIDCGVVVDSSKVTTVLYGKKTPVLPAVIRCTDIGAGTVTIAVEQIMNAALPVSLMDTSDAIAALTKVYQNQAVQVWARILEGVESGIGIYAAVHGPGLSNWVIKLLGISAGFQPVLDQSIIPTILGNQPGLTKLLANTLDGGGPIVLSDGQGATRKAFVPAPDKGQTIVMSAHFQFESISVIKIPAPSVVMPKQFVNPNKAEIEQWFKEKEPVTKTEPIVYTIPALETHPQVKEEVMPDPIESQLDMVSNRIHKLDSDLESIRVQLNNIHIQVERLNKPLTSTFQ